MKRTLKEHRLHLRLSQADLAERSGISLRTIQRIESGSSTGSPYVIRALCKSLGVEPESLITHPEEPRKESPDQISESAGDTGNVWKGYDKSLKYVNFSALSVLCFPFLNLVVPAIFYFVFKKSLSDDRDKAAALKIISLQILWSVFTLILIVLIPVIQHFTMTAADLLEVPLFVWGYLFMVVLLVLTTLNTANRINKAKKLLVSMPDIL